MPSAYLTIMKPTNNSEVRTKPISVGAIFFACTNCGVVAVEQFV